jgi:CDP-diacylglycerol--glycerol-3-phosphate 3-phosphatidyltransferase
VGRIVLALVLFVVLHFQMYAVALAVFVLAASTDWVDGYIARKTGQVTRLGRILDPFADKVIVCGVFIYLAAVDSSGIRPWMAVVVVGRELLVTALRGYLEQHGKDFSAQMPGKLKMVLQCAAAMAGMLAAIYAASENTVPPWLSFTASGLAWLAVLSTVYSGAIYVAAALRLMRTLV